MADRTLTKSQEVQVAVFVEALVMHGLGRDLALSLAHAFAEGLVGKLRLAVKAPTAMVAAQTGATIHQYRVLYVAKYHEDPMVTPDDIRKVQKLLAQYGGQAVAARLVQFMAWADPWVEHTAGRTIRTFFSQWNRLAQMAAGPRGQAPAECKHEPICPNAVAHSQKLLAERTSRFSATTSRRRTTSTPSDPS